jgi:competence protein ComEA
MNITLSTLTRALVLAMALPLAAAGVRSAKAKTSAPQHPINLNSATVTELMQLPKIGAKTAERVIQFRKEHGGFRRSEELMNVKGIGEKSFVKLKPYLTVGVGAGTAVEAVSSPITVVSRAKQPRPKHAAARK